MISGSVTATDSLDTAAYDEVIDARSPAEFAEDHIPGAINLPVLDNNERADVGTIYKQESPFLARKRGAALIARNAARFIDAHFADKPGGYRPLVYCWRGGQRSGALAIILSQIGWRVTTLKGGYKSYRAHVIDRLYEQALPFPLRVITGLTGTAKTRLLHALAAKGGRVIDLEGLANHKGSLLGADPASPQPSQKMFESRCSAEIARLAKRGAAPVFIEAESSKVGQRNVPPAIWTALQASGLIEISAPMPARVAQIKQDYPHFFDRPGELIRLLGHLRPLHGHSRIDAWAALAEAADWDALVEQLLVEHYDPAYRRSMGRNRRPMLARHSLPDLSDTTIARLADALLAEAAPAPGIDQAGTTPIRSEA